MSESKKLFLGHIVRKIFFEDWGLKLVALLITFTLWFGVTGLSEPTTKRLRVPLNLSVAADAQIVNSPQQDVEIEISGDKRTIDQIKSSDLTATVDLSAMDAGNWVVSLSPETTSVAPLPARISVTDVAPGRIAVNLERVEEKEVDVSAETIGEPAAGFEVYATTILPPKVRVRGPASVIRELEGVRTDRISLAGKKEDFTARQVTIMAADPPASVLNTVVDVFFRIGERRSSSTYTVPVPGPGGREITFTLYGPRTAVTRLRVDAVRAEIVLDETGRETPRIVLPPEMQGLVEIRNVRIVP